MLQSFSQFLPASLQLSDPHARTATPALEENRQLGLGHPTSPLNKDINAHGAAHEASELRKKVKKEKPANETFIFVRPPPAKNNHPLNLQVQLVPPTSKDKVRSRGPSDASSRPTSSAGAEDEAETGSNLSRTQSAQSSQSAYSQNTTSSNASISSYASSNTSGRRMIIPLYNLQAHNVMTNTVVDAGTDAKVAKFKGRGVEIIGLACLEPVEVWGDSYQTDAMGGRESASARTSTDLGSGFSHSSAGTPTAPSFNATRTPTQDSLAAMPTQPATPTGAKKMFGKMFRRAPRPGSSASASPSFFSSSSNATVVPASPAPSGSGAFLALDSPRNSLALPGSPMTPTAQGASAAAAVENTPALRPPILGITPTFASPTSPPIGRPNKYVWVVKRWLKVVKGGEGLNLNLMALGGKVGSRLAGKDSPPNGTTALVEVRFEWTRGRTGARRKARPRRGDSVGSGDRDRDRLSPEKGAGTSDHPSNRFSMVSHTTSSDSHSPPLETDDGDESDPEDSETPWTCALAVTRIPAPAPSTSSFGSAASSLAAPTPPSPPADPGIRIKVATLSPTPHHPKVVSMLKVPYPLPDIEVERVVVRRRAGVSAHNGAGLVLTAEEIKDVISCTGLWLVVREGFGGVGRVGRKGDGWRLRA